VDFTHRTKPLPKLQPHRGADAEPRRQFNSLANKLKKVGYSAFVEPVQTSRGTLWRVRVGGYGTRPEADAARVALKGEGYSGIIAPSQ
jgi:cell division septation protein DedD